MARSKDSSLLLSFDVATLAVSSSTAFKATAYGHVASAEAEDEDFMMILHTRQRLDV